MEKEDFECAHPERDDGFSKRTSIRAGVVGDTHAQGV